MSQLSWRDESGKSSIRGLIALALIIGMGYVGVKFLPVRASAYAFNDAIRDEIVYASNRRTNNEQIKKNLLERAAMLGLPIKPENLVVTRTGSQASNRWLVIEANYTVTIEMVGGYTYDWEFNKRDEGPVFGS